MIGDWAYATAVVVWAYGVGGARLVGIWVAVRYLLMAIVSPIGCIARGPAPAQGRAHRQRPGARRARRASRRSRSFADAPDAVDLRRGDACSPSSAASSARPRWPGCRRSPDARGAHRCQRRVQHDREPGLLPRPRPRGPARERDVRPGRLPPQRRHVRAVRHARVGHPRRSPVAEDTRRRGKGLRRRGRGRSPRRSACCGEMAGGFTAHRPRPGPDHGRDPRVHPDHRRRGHGRLRRRPRRRHARDRAPRRSASSTRSSVSGPSSAASTRSPAPPRTGSRATSPWARCSGPCPCSSSWRTRRP